MALLGLLLLITGVIMNIQVLRRARGVGLDATQTLRLTPWQVSVGLVIAGMALLLVGSKL